MKSLRIPRYLLVDLPEWPDLKNQVIFYDSIMEHVYIPVDTYWATWVMMRISHPDICQIDVLV